jgi:hypothetical protein
MHKLGRQAALDILIVWHAGSNMHEDVNKALKAECEVLKNCLIDAENQKAEVEGRLVSLSPQRSMLHMVFALFSGIPCWHHNGILSSRTKVA